MRGLKRRLDRLAKLLTKPPAPDPIICQMGQVDPDELEKAVARARDRGDMVVIVGQEFNPAVFGSGVQPEVIDEAPAEPAAPPEDK